MTVFIGRTCRFPGMSPSIGHDGSMNRNDARRTPHRRGSPDPVDYAARRLRSLLLVPAAIVSVAGLVVAEAAGLGHELSIATGVAAFLGATAIQTLMVPPRSAGQEGAAPTSLDAVPTWNK